MESTELRKANGDIYLIVERMADNSYIHARWIGIQNRETVIEGGKFYLQMLLEKSCDKLLNDHHELIGPWNVANEWIVHEWTPKIRTLGLRYMAQVLAPGIYGQISFRQLHQLIDDRFEIRMFNDEVSAKKWLLQVGTAAAK